MPDIVLDSACTSVEHFRGDYSVNRHFGLHDVAVSNDYVIKVVVVAVAVVVVTVSHLDLRQ